MANAIGCAMAGTTLQSSILQRREQQAPNAPQLLLNTKTKSRPPFQHLPPQKLWPPNDQDCDGSCYNHLDDDSNHLRQRQVDLSCIRNRKRKIDYDTPSLQSEVRALDDNNSWNFGLFLNSNMNDHDRRDCMGQNFTTANRPTKFSSDSYLSVLLIASILLCFHNALPCSSFSGSQLDNDSDFVDFDYPPVTIAQRSYLNPNYNGPRSIWHRQLRSYDMPENGNPHHTDLMSSIPGSLSQDEPSSTNPDAAQSWTSILTNPFGSGSSVSSNDGGNDAFDKHIKAILVPRVSGTPGNVRVRQYIMDNLKSNDYHVELDEFISDTPVGNVKFANIIASSNPNACRQLVLACHYDSKLMDGFLGASDSAVPCAMLLRISETFSKSYRPSSEGTNDEGHSDSLGLKFIFFDGEEAFKQWTSIDSLYGSRHLAAKWAKQEAPAQCGLGVGKTELDRIELFVLLDLIGTSDTSFVMYNTRLRNHYESLQSYERAHLSKDGHDRNSVRRNMAFRTRTVPMDFMEDDHVPFKKRGVPILLLLAHPFPRVWHKISDNYQAIDFPKTRRILHVLEKFVENYPRKKVQ